MPEMRFVDDRRAVGDSGVGREGEVGIARDGDAGVATAGDVTKAA